MITGTFNKIPRKKNSHGYGWARTWAENLNTSINHDGNPSCIIYVDHGVNFGGGLNLFGGFNDELKKRIDIVPISLAIAQAAIESGWGTSRFAIEGNAYFGQKVIGSKIRGIKPNGIENPLVKIRTFDNLNDSVNAYINNLNTHFAYKNFRKSRNELRSFGKIPEGIILVKQLKKYSELGEEYVKKVYNTKDQKKEFEINTKKIITEKIDFKFIESDFRKVNFNHLGKFNIYCYDALHDEKSQYDGISLVQPALDDIFILIIDDWNWSEVRKGTLEALNNLKIDIISKIEIRTTQDNNMPKIFVGQYSEWHNGYFIAVCEKK